MDEKMVEEAKACEGACKNHADVKSDHADVEVVVNICGKQCTMDEAEKIYNRLKKLFETTVVINPYNPVREFWPDWTRPFNPYNPYAPYWENLPDSPTTAPEITYCITFGEEE